MQTKRNQGDWIFIDNKTGMNSQEPEWFRKERGYALHSFPGELYDLKNDPHEMDNRFDDPAWLPARKELTDMIRARPDDIRPRAAASGIA